MRARPKFRRILFLSCNTTKNHTTRLKNIIAILYDRRSKSFVHLETFFLPSEIYCNGTTFNFSNVVSNDEERYSDVENINEKNSEHENNKEHQNKCDNDKDTNNVSKSLNKNLQKIDERANTSGDSSDDDRDDTKQDLYVKTLKNIVSKLKNMLEKKHEEENEEADEIGSINVMTSGDELKDEDDGDSGLYEPLSENHVCHPHNDLQQDGIKFDFTQGFEGREDVENAQTEINTKSSSTILATLKSQHLRSVLFPECSKYKIHLDTCFYTFLHFKDANDDLTEEMKGMLVKDDKTDDVAHMMNKISECLELSTGKEFWSVQRIKNYCEENKNEEFEEVDDNAIVKLRGLPWQCLRHDVAQFFSGLNITCIIIAPGSVAKKNGEAIVVFENEDMRDMALMRHREYLGLRYIEVYRSNFKEYLTALASSGNRRAQNILLEEYGTFNPIIVRMRGLPFSCQAPQVVSFFRKEPIPCEIIDEEKGVLFVYQSDGKISGDAFILLTNDEEAQKAMSKHKQLIGSRYIELFKSSPFEAMQVLLKNMDPRLPLLMNPGQFDDKCQPTIPNLLKQQLLFMSSHLFQSKIPFVPSPISPVSSISPFSSNSSFDNFNDQSKIEFFYEPVNNCDFDCTNNIENIPAFTDTNPNMIYRNQNNSNAHFFTSPTKHLTNKENYEKNDFTMNNKEKGDQIDMKTLIKDPNTSKTCIKIKGLPAETTMNDLIHFFEDFSHLIKEKGIHFVYNNDGTSRREALIEMIGEKETTTILNGKKDKLIFVGSKRYNIEILNCSLPDRLHLVSVKSQKNANVEPPLENPSHQFTPPAFTSAFNLIPPLPNSIPLIPLVILPPDHSSFEIINSPFIPITSPIQLQKPLQQCFIPQTDQQLMPTYYYPQPLYTYSFPSSCLSQQPLTFTMQPLKS